MISTISSEPGLMVLIASIASLIILVPITIAVSRIRYQMAVRLGFVEKSSGTEDRPSHRRNVRLMERIGRAVSQTASGDTSRLRAELMKAGYFSENAPFIFYGARIFCIVAPQVALLSLAHLSPIPLGKIGVLLLTAAFAIVGYFIPSMIVNRQLNKRIEQYRDGFPDMIDLLVACVEAGLSIDAALARIADEMRGRYEYLAGQVYLMSLETRAGRDQNVAWQNFADRVGLEEARSLAVMLKQANDFGTSVGETLRIFSIDMRDRRMLIAEEKALSLPAKMILPLILFVFPTLLVVLIMPGVVRMITIFGETAS